MSKSRAFSLFLLKSEFNVQNALKEEHSLEKVPNVTLPDNAELFLADVPQIEPWWKSYLGISKDLLQGLKGAILFLTVNGRTFALTFGNVYHNLKEESYEYDFGLLTTLNSIDPDALKSTDVLQPESALRQRIQTPKSSNLTFFDFDKDSSIIKRLTGKVKEEYTSWFTNTTGANNLRITTKKQLSDLPSLCSKLLAIYQKEDYKTLFPDLHNIRPIKDPNQLQSLNTALLLELQRTSQDILLTIPEIVDYSNISGIKFSQKQSANLYENIDIADFYSEAGDSLQSLTIKMLRSEYPVTAVDENNHPVFHHSLYKSLIWDYTNSNNESFHFCDGNWYQVEQNYLRRLTRTVDAAFIPYAMPDFHHKSEGAYNADVPNLNTEYICLDRKNISSVEQVEPCDLYKAENGNALFIHVKIGTRSALLSHLFNQGVNSIVLINSDPAAKQKLKTLITLAIGKNNLDDYLAPVDNRKSKIIFAIISSKDASQKSKILPLFSKISLRRAIQSLKSMNMEFAVTVIKDLS